jgi:hypothetical protein
VPTPTIAGVACFRAAQIRNQLCRCIFHCLVGGVMGDALLEDAVGEVLFATKAAAARDVCAGLMAKKGMPKRDADIMRQPESASAVSPASIKHWTLRLLSVPWPNLRTMVVWTTDPGVRHADRAPTSCLGERRCVWAPHQPAQTGAPAFGIAAVQAVHSCPRAVVVPMAHHTLTVASLLHSAARVRACCELSASEAKA